MPAATISTLNPPTGTAGIEITLLGLSFAAGATVSFGSGERVATDPQPVVVSSTEIRAVVPDMLDGDAGTLLVTVLNPGEQASNELEFWLEAWPAVESVYPLCSLAALKAMLGVARSDTADDERYKRLIRIASAQIAGAAQRPFDVADVVGERHDGDGTPELELDRTPIISVSALAIDGQAVDVSDLAIYPVTIAFSVDGDWNPRLRASSRIFPRGLRNIAVSYRGGYVKIPADVADACCIQVAFLMNTLNKQGIISESNAVAQATTAYDTKQLAPPVRTVCNRYRRRKVAIV
jgi:hypothetical protein